MGEALQLTEEHVTMQLGMKGRRRTASPKLHGDKEYWIGLYVSINSLPVPLAKYYLYEVNAG